ncbi:uncharacterized protein LOC124434610 [Xenia sp. Carnegie-2017]|uniref:uncharacterized protein LOC124434610 n=1 Tax=Xenia sp. Carnegie-2017 TaxID=2897299 RepID=UPI001F03C5B3|nr:uncharacterized protein LOC124434610 [Xenia sp. Carnegie-2017]
MSSGSFSREERNATSESDPVVNQGIREESTVDRTSECKDGKALENGTESSLSIAKTEGKGEEDTLPVEDTVTDEENNIANSKVEISAEQKCVADNVVEDPEVKNDVADNVVEVPDVKSDVVDNVVEAPDVKSDVADNVVEVPDMKSDVVENVVEVLSEKSDVVDNVAEVLDEKSDVADNVVEVTDEKSDVADNVVEVPDMKSDVVDNVVQVPGEKSDAVGNVVEVPNKKSDVVDNVVEVPDEKSDVVENVVEVPDEKSGVADNVEVSGEKNYSVDETGETEGCEILAKFSEKDVKNRENGTMEVECDNSDQHSLDLNDAKTNDNIHRILNDIPDVTDDVNERKFGLNSEKKDVELVDRNSVKYNESVKPEENERGVSEKGSDVLNGVHVDISKDKNVDISKEQLIEVPKEERRNEEKYLESTSGIKRIIYDENSEKGNDGSGAMDEENHVQLKSSSNFDNSDSCVASSSEMDEYNSVERNDELDGKSIKVKGSGSDEGIELSKEEMNNGTKKDIISCENSHDVKAHVEVFGNDNNSSSGNEMKGKSERIGSGSTVYRVQTDYLTRQLITKRENETHLEEKLAEANRDRELAEQKVKDLQLRLKRFAKDDEAKDQKMRQMEREYKELENQMQRIEESLDSKGKNNNEGESIESVNGRQKKNSTKVCILL